MKRTEYIIVLIILTGCGLFPAQAHTVVDFAAGTVAGVLNLFSAIGLHVDRSSAEAVTILALVVIVIGVLVSLIASASSARGRR